MKPRVHVCETCGGHTGRLAWSADGLATCWGCFSRSLRRCGFKLEPYIREFVPASRAAGR